jgi:hypothetical protein
VAHPERTAAVLAVLPPWSGEPGDAPAAVSARHTAATLRRDGLEATTSAMRASSPPWLADELARSWARQWPALPEAMDNEACIDRIAACARAAADAGTRLVSIGGDHAITGGVLLGLAGPGSQVTGGEPVAHVDQVHRVSPLAPKQR